MGQTDAVPARFCSPAAQTFERLVDGPRRQRFLLVIAQCPKLIGPPGQLHGTALDFVHLVALFLQQFR